MAEITLVKGDTSVLDRTWMSMPDGSTRQVAVHVVHDLPHLVVESLFGIEDGLWGVLGRACRREGRDQRGGEPVAGRPGHPAAWARVPAGGMLRLQWPLPRAVPGS